MPQAAITSVTEPTALTASERAEMEAVASLRCLSVPREYLGTVASVLLEAAQRFDNPSAQALRDIAAQALRGIAAEALREGRS